MQIRAVAFDVDGTLYKNATLYLRTAGWAISNLRLFGAFRKARIDLRAIRPIDDFKTRQSELVAGYYGVSPEIAYKLVDEKIYGELAKAFKGIPLAKGIRECLNSLKQNGLKLAVLSDFPVDQKLIDIGLGDYWDLTISTEDLGYLKPNSEGFKALVEGLGLSAKEVLYVGNSYRYDIMGASLLGMRTAHFANKTHTKSVADFTFDDYANLVPWILKKT